VENPMRADIDNGDGYWPVKHVWPTAGGVAAA
jgi:hypothetical protein